MSILGQPDIVVAWLKANEVMLFANDHDESKALVVPATVVSDMEVKNKDELYQLIKTWVSEHTYTKAEIVWIVDHELCFTAAIASDKLESLDTEVVKFLELLPFSETFSHVYDTSDGGKQVIAINKSLMDSYRQGFEIQGYDTRMVVPEIRLSAEAQKHAGTKEIFKYVSSKLSELGKEKIVDEVYIAHKAVKSTVVGKDGKEQPKSQLKLLLTVFGVLVAVLAIVIYLTYFRK